MKRFAMLAIAVCLACGALALLCSPSRAATRPGRNPLGRYCKVTVVNGTGEPVTVEYSYDGRDRCWPSFCGTLSSGRSATRHLCSRRGTIYLKARSLSRGSNRGPWKRTLSVRIDESYRWQIR
jgi:hypothetical protein